MKIKIFHVTLGGKLAHILAHLLILLQKPYSLLLKECQWKSWKIAQGCDTVWQRLSHCMHLRAQGLQPVSGLAGETLTSLKNDKLMW